VHRGAGYKHRMCKPRAAQNGNITQAVLFIYSLTGVGSWKTTNRRDLLWHW